VLWLVFSVLKKVIGLVVLAAVAATIVLLWQNPALLDILLSWVRDRA
jgi:hypothetical protein